MIPGTPSPERAALHDQLEKVWGNPRGWRALSLVNHSTVAQRFMVTGGVFFVLAGLLSMLMRAQLALPNHDFMGAEAYNQAFTMHGTIMMFLFAVPILQGLAAYLLPKMLGARDLVFPRLSSFGYWCYLFGGIIFCSSLLFGLAPDAGWFMYTPLSRMSTRPGSIPTSGCWASPSSRSRPWPRASRSRCRSCARARRACRSIACRCSPGRCW